MKFMNKINKIAVRCKFKERKISGSKNLSEIEDGLKIEGSKLRIFSIPKRKRKGSTLDYYIGVK